MLHPKRLKSFARNDVHETSISQSEICCKRLFPQQRSVNVELKDRARVMVASFFLFEAVDRNIQDIKRMARQAWESWGSWSSDIGTTLDQAASSSLGRQGSSGARTVRGGAVVTARLVGHACHHDRWGGPLRSRCEWSPSSSEPITLHDPVPPIPCRFPLRPFPRYRAVSQGNWLVNSVKPPSPCATP